MNRLTTNDKNIGPITIAKWSKQFSAYVSSGNDEHPQAYLLLTAFGLALRVPIWSKILPLWKERWVECNWDAETVKRLGRTGYWATHERRFGFALSNMGNGYDFFQLFYGPSTHDSSTTKCWSKFIPWKQWRNVRHSLYTPKGEHFFTELKWNPNNGDKSKSMFVFFDQKEKCPSVSFGFEDYDGEFIVAKCLIEEMEWRRGEGWFKWLGFIFKPKIKRSLDISFDREVGPEKGSYKGGTIGHGIGMNDGESPQQAFERYCSKEHTSRHRKFVIKFIGPMNRKSDQCA